MVILSFYGEVAADNLPVISASKGIILNSRILWFFSEVATELKTEEYRQAAQRDGNPIDRHRKTLPRPIYRAGSDVEQHEYHQHFLDTAT